GGRFFASLPRICEARAMFPSRRRPMELALVVAVLRFALIVLARGGTQRPPTHIPPGAGASLRPRRRSGGHRRARSDRGSRCAARHAPLPRKANPRARARPPLRLAPRRVAIEKRWRRVSERPLATPARATARIVLPEPTPA